MDPSMDETKREAVIGLLKFTLSQNLSKISQVSPFHMFLFCFSLARVRKSQAHGENISRTISQALKFTIQPCTLRVMFFLLLLFYLISRFKISNCTADVDLLLLNLNKRNRNLQYNCHKAKIIYTITIKRVIK